VKRKLLVVFLVVLFGGGLLVRQAWRKAIAHGAAATIAAIHGTGLAGLFALFGSQVLVAATGLLPASLLAIAAGAAFGLLPGCAISATGVLMGAVASFAISRSMFRPFIARHLAKSMRLDRFDRALARDSWRFVCVIRLSPVMPFAIASFALGLSSIGFRAYCLGTLASLPALFLYVYLGTLAKAGAAWLATGTSAWQWAGAVAGVLATLLLCWRLAQVAKFAMMPGDRAVAD
jgi:uncharacterized membrane protein YdjX (TVP38/TMEM64 family)